MKPASTLVTTGVRRAFVARIVLGFAVLFGRLSSTESAFGQGWADVRKTGDITLLSEVRLEQFSGLLRIVEQQQADVVATLNLNPVSSPIEIRIFANSRSYRAAVAKSAPEGIDRRAVFTKDVDGIGRVFLYVHSEFETDLRHELTHAILHSMLPFVPLWLDEGLAEYFEVAAEDRASNHPHQSRLKWSMRFGWQPNLKRLEAKESLAQMAIGDYREAWGWTHFLLHGSDNGTLLLQRYLQSIQRGEPPGPFSSQLAKLDANPARQLSSHLKSWK
jgi:hypothetical protein